MKKTYILLLFLIAGISKNYGQPNLSYTESSENDITISSEMNARTVKVIYAAKEKSDLQINIKNEKGETVYHENIAEKRSRHEKKIDLSAQAKGVYFIEVDSQSLNQVERVEFN